MYYCNISIKIYEYVKICQNVYKDILPLSPARPNSPGTPGNPVGPKNKKLFKNNNNIKI